MSTLQQMRQGFSRAWDHLAEGWHDLRERAGHALTHFKPGKSDQEADTDTDTLVHNASRWGLLAAEVSEDDEQIEVRLEAPGMEADNFEVKMIGSTLIIQGEKRIERQQHKGHYRLMECAYGHFERAIPLPAEVDDDKARARYRRGVLHITLPKSTPSRSQRIEVTAD